MIVLNGGYVDDLDLGDEIIYTGHGGNKDGKQIADQYWEATGNKALIVSELKGLPVRFTRGYKHKSSLSPSTGYEYGGLYRVTHHFQVVGKEGFKICRYRLEKIDPSTSNLERRQISLPLGQRETTRVQITTLRVVRDTELAKAIKELYDYRCQICATRIAVRGIAYAEEAHIRPLGMPHNGADTPDNTICLCPNHHVMFDKGCFTIDSNYHLIGTDGCLFVDEQHNIDTQNLKYHRDHIFYKC